jgi:hypothetical protein
MKVILASAFAIILLLPSQTGVEETLNHDKPRLIVTTDGEID